MKLFRTIMLAVVLTTLSSSAVFAAHDGWVTDFEAAKKQAQAEGKYLLVDFTGSDWCGWCIRLVKEVFSQEQFKKEAPKQFVLVELDFPRDKSKMSKELIQQNKELQKKYKISGFPSILLMDADGNTFAKTGYQPGGPEKYLAHLTKLVDGKKAFDAAIAKANKAKGLKKAKLLDKALSSLDPQTRKSHKDLAMEICKLDKDNKAGLKNKYEFAAAMDALEGAQPKNPRDPKVIEAFFGNQLKKCEQIEKKFKPKGPEMQKLLSMKAMFTFYTKDLKGCLAIIDQAIAINPESKEAKNMKPIRGFVVKQIEAQKKKTN